MLQGKQRRKRREKQADLETDWYRTVDIPEIPMFDLCMSRESFVLLMIGRFDYLNRPYR